MKPYLDMMRNVFEYGDIREGRNGETRSLFTVQLRHSVANGFPLLTTKKVFWESIVSELCWFISGSRDVKNLQLLGSNIWNANANDPIWKVNPYRQFEGDVGRIYGQQWRSWTSVYEKNIDQLACVINEIKVNPNSRRHIVTAWNPAELDEVCLPPCHIFYQFYVNGHDLSLSMYQRSCDLFLGVPFNIASYALLLMIVAKLTSLKPKEVIYTFGDLHIYEEHFKQVEMQLGRKPKKLPTVSISDSLLDIDQVYPYQFKLHNYEHHPHIKAKMIL